ncbi:MAG: hypothetical protein Q8K92_00305 [Leadbetterella sp.]|nr:hypothetical protein [Leadbetterella sp.]
MMKFFIALFCASTLFSCGLDSDTEDNKIQAILDSLKTDQAVIRLNINNKPFYADTTLFAGNGIIDEKGIKVSLKDQDFGNVIVSIEGENWNKTKPYKIEFNNGYPMGSNMGSFLVGKITDLKQNKGEGYLLSDGFFEVKYLSKDIFVVNVKGKLKQPFGDSALTPVEGYIIWKTPGYTLNEGQDFVLPFKNEK